jgi:zinc transport system substrate-binding protein
MKRFVFAAAILGAILVCAGGVLAGEGGAKVKVVVSILPQEYFVERVGGERVEVEVLVGPGQSPHTYEPTPKQVAALADGQVYFRIGMPFEDVLAEKIKGMFPGLRVVDTRKGITLRRMTADEAAADAREEGAHSGTGGEPDPHTWLDPRLVKVQARTIADALEEIDAGHREEYEKNLAAFVADLDAVDKRIRAALAGVKGRDFFVYHPAFGYFADAYGLRQVPVEIEGKEPGAKQLATLIDRAKAEHVKVIFVQAQFSSKWAQTVAQAIGGAVVPMDDLAKDYIRNLENMASLVEQGVAGQGAQEASGR